MNDEAIATFAQSLRGPVIGRNHPEYDEARKLYNAMIDKRPLLIARCADVADVIAAVKFGRDNKLPIAIRGGGHNGPGLGSVNDGLVIDLSTMKGVRVDPAKRTVRVGPGCATGDVDHATHAFGQAVPFGIVSTTGVGGLTLSGGHGYLSRQYGLAVDNLLEADVVLADGSFVTASETENADLFWALRGGGGNFGVVTSFLFRTNPAGMVYAGPIIFELADGAAVTKWFRQHQPKAADEFYMFLGLQSVPPGDPFPKEHWSKKMCVLLVSHNGPLAEGEKAVNGVRAALPKPIIDWAQPMPYPALQSLFDPLYPKGMQWYWKGDFVKDLPDAAVDAHIAHANRMPGPLCAMHLYPIDGAVHLQKKDASAWSCRDASWSMVIAGIDPDPAKAPALKQWARDYWEAVHPFDLAGAYPNFMMDDEGDARVKAAYGGNYDRLASLKKKYDPANLFHVNQNIRPAAA
ncbi:MAG TPA: FAD-binding oxidoreductase [Roseiarcus sp.]|jgi:FAD/FMN-containing dehydrogenase|nr:FAD-binding oxidoreductase [Roseiarcus sp.]